MVDETRACNKTGGRGLGWKEALAATTADVLTYRQLLKVGGSDAAMPPTWPIHLPAEAQRQIQDANLHWEALASTAKGTLADEVRWLSDAEFGEDALEIVDVGGMWEAAALADGDALVGFVVYGVLSGRMSLRYIAVASKQRGRGLSRRLVERVRRRCVEQGVRELTLFTKREMVPFYCSLGFAEVIEEEEDSEDDLQVPMSCIVLAEDEEAIMRVTRVEESVVEEAEEAEEWHAVQRLAVAS
eukprot:TRINITY_DN3458_c0_g1_i1.p1 TRINITY_DN3458_c0_g1~~TRINITY_DN3458_c0_g1_i1.p1  ORF type:complete len:243 (-),score=59.49 TRINITY_DN3458_c0_g1_i1:126-854(-)